MLLTVQSQRQQSEVCQPVQLITPPLSHSGQRLFAGEPKRGMGLWRSTHWHSNSSHFFHHPLNYVTSFILCHMMRFHFPHGELPAIPPRTSFPIRMFRLLTYAALSHWTCFLFYTLLTKCDFHMEQCTHRMFYSPRFLVSLHLRDTPQWQEPLAWATAFC